MTSFGRFAAVVAGYTTAGLAAWLVIDVRAQTAQTDGIHVCVASDRVLRLAQSDRCPPGEKDLYFKKPEMDLDAAKSDKDVEADTRRIAALERRIQNLEESANRGEFGNKVVAPFEVVDRAGKRILRVTDERKVELYNGAGKIVAGLVATGDGGRFVAISAGGDLTAGIGAFEKYAGLGVNENGVKRIDLGRDAEQGTYRLKVFGSGGALLAGMGQSAGGTGLAFVADKVGTIRARIMIADAKKGLVSISNTPGTYVATLSEGVHGGVLTIANSSGEPMVDAGVTAGRFGVVRAGPASFKSGFGVLGLPGSYIAGKPQ